MPKKDSLEVVPTAEIVQGGPEQHVHLPDASPPDVQHRALDVRLLDVFMAHEEALVKLVLDMASVATKSAKHESRTWKQITKLQLEVLEARERVAKREQDGNDDTKATASALLLDKAAQLMGLGAEDAGEPTLDVSAIADSIDDDTKLKLMAAFAGGKKE